MALKTSTAVFQTVAVGGQSNVVVDSASDVLTLTGSSPILITTDASTDTVTFAHATTDGNLHVPATSTTNSGKVLTAGATAGSLSWQTPAAGGTGTVTSVAAGNGMTFTTITATGSVTMGTPSSLTGATTNALTASSHTHAVSLTASDVGAIPLSGGTTTGSLFIGGGLMFAQRSTNNAYQRADGRVDATTFSRLHKYGVTDLGATSNFREAWYDGTAYVNVEATAQTITLNTHKIWTAGNLGAGNGLTGDASGLAMGTPSTLTTATANATTATSHTHTVTFPVTSVNTLTGAVTLTASSVSAATVRTISTSAPSGGVSGDVWYVV